MSPADTITWFGIAVGSIGLVVMNVLGWRMLREDRKMRERYGLPRRR